MVSGTSRSTKSKQPTAAQAARSRAQIAEERARKQEKALRLRTMRVSYDEIARQCGYASRGAAHSAVKAALAAIPREAGKELRISELEGLDIAERALARSLARGDLRAIDRMLKIKDMRAKLTGLYDETTDTGVEEVSAVLGAFMGQAIRELDAGDLDDEGMDTDD